MDQTRHLIVGRGEVGSAIEECLHLSNVKVDWADLNHDAEGTYPYLHICIPWSDTFCDTVTARIKKHAPIVCIIHSTVLPGTTDRIQDSTSTPVAYSPVRGRHGQMVHDLIEFIKYVGAPNIVGAQIAANALFECGFTVKVTSSARVLELAKLFQTTYTGVLVAWAQEMQRYCNELGVNFVESQLLNEMPNLPHVIHRPGFIGGHCVIQNTVILDEIAEGLFTQAIRTSNELVGSYQGEQPQKRLWPIPYRQNR